VRSSWRCRLPRGKWDFGCFRHAGISKGTRNGTQTKAAQKLLSRPGGPDSRGPHPEAQPAQRRGEAGCHQHKRRGRAALHQQPAPAPSGNSPAQRPRRAALTSNSAAGRRPALNQRSAAATQATSSAFRIPVERRRTWRRAGMKGLGRMSVDHVVGTVDCHYAFFGVQG